MEGPEPHSCVRNSNIFRNIKLSFIYATAQSVPFHGSEGWILKPTLQKSLDRCYTRMLHAILNINKNEHATNKHLQRAE